MNKELLLKRELRSIIERLVKDAEDLAEATKFYEDKEFKENQIRNVIGVAASSGSVLVVTNFIKYQIGREKDEAKGWQRKGFGEELIKKLESYKDLAEDIARRVNEGSKKMAGEKVEAREVWLTLCQYFLGYLDRYFKYKKPK